MSQEQQDKDAAAAAAATASNETTTLHNDYPKRYIYNDHDLQKFLDSPAKSELLKLVSTMGRSCATVRSYEYNPQDPLVGLSPPMACLHGALTEMKNHWVADFPPDDTVKARFGNPSFKKWHDRLVEKSPSIVYAILKVNQECNNNNNNNPQSSSSVEGSSSSSSSSPQPDDEGNYEKEVLVEAFEKGVNAASAELSSAIVDLETDIKDQEDRTVIGELCAYLHDSFGHAVRLDYGTGHESSFQVFLFALLKVGCFGSKRPGEAPTAERLKAVTLSIYSAYLAVTRQVQTDYMLEPAGSHGVWGLDDYYCLSFYFGACQMQALDDNVELASPSCIHNEELDGDKLLYIGCIRYIKSLKKGVPFFECSPMLNDISNLNSWSKVSSGLLRLYEGEVLKKRPVVQHFVFGKLFPANWKPSHAPRPPPPGNESFRSAAPPVAGVGVKAPWTATAQLPATRAPWANDPEANPMPSTKAPWAK